MRALFPKAPEDDLLKRFKLAAFEEQATHIVRLTADCWEMPAQLIAEVVKLIEKRDYVSNTIRRTFPEGFDVQACSYRALEWFDVNQKEEREHPFKMFDLNEYNRVRFEKDGLSYTELLNPQLRFLIKGSSIDTKQDLEDARRWYAETQKADDRISRKSEDRARPGISGDEQQETHAVS